MNIIINDPRRKYLPATRYMQDIFTNFFHMGITANENIPSSNQFVPQNVTPLLDHVRNKTEMQTIVSRFSMLRDQQKCNGLTGYRIRT